MTRGGGSLILVSCYCFPRDSMSMNPPISCLESGDFILAPY